MNIKQKMKKIKVLLNEINLEAVKGNYPKKKYLTFCNSIIKNNLPKYYFGNIKIKRG